MQNSTDFFSKTKYYRRLCYECFGILDKETSNEPSVIKTTDIDKCNCKVANYTRKEVDFYPLDKVINSQNISNRKSCCDVMLCVDNNRLIFIELKNRRKSKDYFKDAVLQLKNTIRWFCDIHDLGEWRRREAFISNSKHPKFAFSRKDECEKFYRETKFRLLPKWEVVV